jgi:nitrile hydratase
MDGVRDLGGRQGFGKVGFVPGASAFHAEWEKRTFVIRGLAARLGLYNFDEYRHAIERMEPRYYLNASYCERVTAGIATLVFEKGPTTIGEQEAVAGGKFPLRHPSAPDRTNARDRRAVQRGERVQVKPDFVPGDIRMPGYIQGTVGVITSEGPLTPFPDAEAHRVEAVDEPTYDVHFRSQEHWPGGQEQP